MFIFIKIFVNTVYNLTIYDIKHKYIIIYLSYIYHMIIILFIIYIIYDIQYHI